MLTKSYSDKTKPLLLRRSKGNWVGKTWGGEGAPFPDQDASHAQGHLTCTESPPFAPTAAPGGALP